MQETTLHAVLKDLYTHKGDRQEILVDGYLIDVVSDDLLIEIQTRNFSAIKKKINSLVNHYPVKLVHTIPREKWLVYLPLEESGTILRRKSTRHGRIEDIFWELIRFPELIIIPNFSIDVLITREEEIRINDGRGSWRRKGISIVDRRLIEIMDRFLFSSPQDFLGLIPNTLPQFFTNLDLANELKVSKKLATKMSYCLSKMGALTVQGKEGRYILYGR